MTQRCEELYARLLDEIKASREKTMCVKSHIEECFLICNHYKAVVRHELSSYIFETLDEEVNFFRNIMPLFNSEAEFYSLYYHAELFKAEVTDPVRLQYFWERESIRLEKFITENREFYAYYRSGCTEKDAFFFARDYSMSGYNPVQTRYDPMVSMLMGLQRYHEYVVLEARLAG